MAKSLCLLLLFASQLALSSPISTITLGGLKDVLWPRDRPLPVALTKTPSGQTIAWVHRHSQLGGKPVASPPKHLSVLNKIDERLKPELLLPDVERGPEGTVPFVVMTREAAKKIQQKKPPPGLGKKNKLAKRVDYTGHFYGNSGEGIDNHGGSCVMSLFSPAVSASSDFSLIQIGNTNSQQGFIQSAEAGWQQYPDLNGGSTTPHIFTYYTTNGYSADGDNQGGYNTFQAGWVQVDANYYPGMTFSTISTVGGTQYQTGLSYEFTGGNWWLTVNGVQMGYYPGSVYGGANTLGDHADEVGFWGEVYENDSAPTTDMGSGQFANTGFGNAAYMQNLQVTGTDGNVVTYNGGASATNNAWYTIETHYDNTDDRGAYFYVGGPGSG